MTDEHNAQVEPELKPCPFCSGMAEFSVGKTGDGKDWHYIECSECSAMGPRVSYADHGIRLKECLADAWNRRALSSAPVPPSARWRYEIQYGPDGEANYAWVLLRSRHDCGDEDAPRS